MQTNNKDYDPRRDYDQDREQGRERSHNVYAGPGDFDPDYGEGRNLGRRTGGGGSYVESGYDSGDRELPDYAGTPREHDVRRPYSEPLRRAPARERGGRQPSGPHDRPTRGMYAGQRDQDRRYGHPYGGSGQGTRYGYGYDLPRTEEWRQQGPHTGHGPAGYRRPDERIEDEAHERLTRHGSLDASDIRVRVEDGVITLQGTIPDRGSKRMAEDALASIPGVEDIYNELRVRGA